MSLALLVGIGGPAAAQQADEQELPPEFMLSPGDVLEISVLEDQGLNRQVLVRPDGRISLPLVGSLEAAGRTPEQLEATIRAELADDFITPPSVTVALVSLAQEETELEVSSIFVIGQVNAPGRFDFRPEKVPSALQVLAMAGGPGVFAAKTRIQIRRRTEDGEQVILFNYDDIEDGLMLSDGLQLVDGDVIVVPERGLFE